MAEQISIEVIDRVAPTISRKIKDIADQSTRAYGALARLNQQLQGLDSRALNALTRAQNAAVNAQARLISAQARLASVNNQAALSAAKLATQQQKLNQASVQTATAQQRLATQTANAATAMTRAQAAAARYQRQLQSLGQTHARGGRGGGGGGSSVAGIASTLLGATGLGYVYKQINAFQELNNRIASVTGSLEEQQEVLRELTAIAGASYQTVADVTLVFQRFSTTAKQMGIENKELYRVIERIAKATTLAGATTAEATGALRQLGQAFGANRLSGAELNSILEQLPIVIDVLADDLGVVRGAIRGMANAGQIGAKEIIAAFDDTGKGVAELEARFAGLAITWGQAFTILNDRISLSLGNISKVTGASTLFSETIMFLAENMNYLIGPLTALAFLIGYSMVTSLGAATIAQNAFNLAVLRNPYVIAATLIIGMVTALAAFSAENETAAKLWAILGYEVETTLADIKIGFLSLIQGIAEGWDYLFGTDWAGPLEKMVIAAKKARDEIDGVEKRLKDTKTATNALAGAANEFDERWTEMWRSGKKAIESNIDAMHALILTVEQYNRAMSKAGGAKITHYRTSGTGQSDINRIPGTTTGGYRYASGGSVNGPAGRDAVPAMLTAGEFVVNKDSASRFRGVLEAINRGPKGYAEGGLATGQYMPTGQERRETYRGFRIGGKDWEGLTESGFIPGFKPGGQIWQFTGQYGAKTLAAMKQQEQQIRAWKQELTSWWQVERSNIYPIENRAAIDPIINSWKAGLSKFYVDPREFIEDSSIAGNKRNPGYDKLMYKFENVTKMLARAGWAAPVLARSGVWGDTLGKYINYSGPDYGNVVSYGGQEKQEVGGAFGSVNPMAQAFIKSLQGFAQGGGFTVGGSGGPDSQLVQFMASPGEQVSVRTPQQVQHGGMTVNVNMNISGADVQQWQRSENQVVGTLARKIKNYVEQNGLQ